MIEEKVLPIKQVKGFAVANDLTQVIVLGWDGKLAYVATYGETIDDSDQAARGGNKIKEFLGWPNTLKSISPRVLEMKRALEAISADNALLHDANEELARRLEDASRTIDDRERKLEEQIQIAIRLNQQLVAQRGPSIPLYDTEASFALHAVEIIEHDFGQRSEGFWGFLTKAEADEFINARTNEERERLRTKPSYGSFVTYEYMGVVQAHRQRVERLMDPRNAPPRNTYAAKIADFKISEAQ